MTIINKRLINYILIAKRLNEHFGQISIDFWSLEITEIKFEIRNQLEIKLISKSRTRFQQVSDPSSLVVTVPIAFAYSVRILHDDVAYPFPSRLRRRREVPFYIVSCYRTGPLFPQGVYRLQYKHRPIFYCCDNALREKEVWSVTRDYSSLLLRNRALLVSFHDWLNHDIQRRFLCFTLVALRH